MYQHDPRHIDVLVKDLGLENGNSVQTPATPEVTEEEKSEPLSQVQHPQVQITGCQMFVLQPRPSRHNIHRERVVPEDVKSHSAESCQVEEARQVLETRETVGQVFEYGKLAEELAAFTDSDWAGCKETQKSSSAGVLILEGHILEAYTRKQKVIAKSSAEAELYAAVLGASEATGVQSLMRDLGFAVKAVLNIDTKATEHILHRHGIGKLKHTDVAYLWVQDEIRSQRLRVHRVRSEENVADLGTKPLSKAVIAKHCLALGYVNMNQENV